MAGEKVVFVIHDSVELRDAWCKLLRRHGYDPHPFGEPKEAGRFTSKLKPSLIIADWQIGGAELEIKFPVRAMQEHFQGIQDHQQRREWLARNASRLQIEIPQSLGFLERYLLQNPSAKAIIISGVEPVAAEAAIRRLNPAVRRRIKSFDTTGFDLAKAIGIKQQARTSTRPKTEKKATTPRRNIRRRL